MSELTLMLMRIGLLIALWLFVFSIVGVLRSDLYGTAVRARPARRDKKRTARGTPRPAKSTGALDGTAPTDPTKLTVTEGALAGTSLPLRTAGTIIGRASESALVLDDDYASGRHARIFYDGNRWLVEDLGSTNGTFLGATAITEPRPVAVGSVIRIGRTMIELQR